MAYRRGAGPVAPLSDSTVVAEAEEFHVDTAGWRARPYGTNYFAATLANSFLSRQAYLGAPEQCERSVATVDVQIPTSGAYLVLARYEATYRFETSFRITVEQSGKKKLDRLYGARANTKIWAFRKELQKEVLWEWGASDSIVWEGHDASVDLEPGLARITLVADRQPEPAARRNVDLVMLTKDKPQVQKRIAEEGHLPLDGMLTQAGDVFLKVHNRAATPVTVTVPNGTEHSPYWAHLRDWPPKIVRAAAGQSSEWVEVGSVLDTLSDGQWKLTAESEPEGTPHFNLEVGVRTAPRTIESVNRFSDLKGEVELVYRGDTRYSRKVGLADDVLYDLVGWLEAHPVRGTAPTRTLVYGLTFDAHPKDTRYQAAVVDFARLMGATALGQGKFGTLARSSSHSASHSASHATGYLDLSDVPTNKLAAETKKLAEDGSASRIAVVSLGDEIALSLPPPEDHVGFRKWLRGLRPFPKDQLAGKDITQVAYSPTPEAAKATPGLYALSKQYGFRYGSAQLKERTDILRRALPNAGIGANFSPHMGHLYLGPTHQWISLFREGAMTMPWGEDFVFQVPVASPQVNFLMVDMFRAALRGSPNGKIMYYVMPHAPNNTARAWRRQFYGDLGHGVKVLDLFELRPRQVAYTENHVTGTEMYGAIREALHELGTFEDMVQDGHVRPGLAGLWFSEIADVRDDNRAPFDAHKRSLYLAVRHQEIPLDVVVEGDPLAAYKIVYLTDRHVSRAASKDLAAWVSQGGRLVATAGAGMFDELDQPNTVLRGLFGIDPQALEIESDDKTVKLEKQDLPFAPILDTVHGNDGTRVPVIGARSRFSTGRLGSAEIKAHFDDGAPAFAVRSTGKGTASYLGYLPAFAYLLPALPKRPVDRGATDDALIHLLPTKVDLAAVAPLAFRDIERPVECSSPLVETSILESKHGTLVPIVNWSGSPVTDLAVTLRIEVPTNKVTLASGRSVKVTHEGGHPVFHIDLDVADALVLRAD